VDPSDVIQEAYLDVSRKLAEYLGDPSMPFFLWLRLVTGRKLALVHRQHLGVQARDAGREVSLHRGPLPEATSAALAAQLIGRRTTPSQAAARAELRIRLEEALNSMGELDREVLALRHFEHLTNAETARVLGISETAACNRYVRALERLKKILTGPPRGQQGGWPRSTQVPAPTRGAGSSRSSWPATAAASGPRSASTRTGIRSWPTASATSSRCWS